VLQAVILAKERIRHYVATHQPAFGAPFALIAGDAHGHRWVTAELLARWHASRDDPFDPVASPAAQAVSRRA